jgi:hypothetical protein
MMAPRDHEQGFPMDRTRTSGLSCMRNKTMNTRMGIKNEPNRDRWTYGRMDR